MWPQRNTTWLPDIKRLNPRNRASHLRNTETGAAPENFERRCWGGARSMTGGAGQLIVNMTKTCCYYYNFFIWIIKSLYRRISNVYEECGSIIALSLLYDMGARTQSFLFIYFFLRKELILPSFLDVLSIVSCSLREWSASQQWNISQTLEINLQKAWKPIKIKNKSSLIM